MSATLPEPVLAAAQAFLELLDHWNRTHALTALPPADRFEELILDSWALVPFLDSLPSGARVVDFGSGMGIPAVVLALAKPDLEILALDKSGKKVAFIRQAALEMRLENLGATAARIESLAPLEASAGVAKAVGTPLLLAGWWERHGRPGAPFYAMKGPGWADEALPGAAWQLLPHPYRLPTRGARILLEMRKRTNP
ncbi:MAG TPA: RsmG family class I SAM-dependent methyltransferase [Holophaga sp.]|nr:RsmG family class I SAM-dependent methyltransferase [Holophaga sp.]